MASCSASSTNAKPSSRSVLPYLGAGVAVALAVLSFRGVPVERMSELLGGLGAPAALLLLPWVLSISLESWGFRRVFRAVGADVRASVLLRIRITTDSLGNVLPMGALVVEALKPKLLERHAGVRLSTGLAGIAARKYLLVLSQAAYLAVGFFAGREALRAAFGRLTGIPELAWVALAGAAALAAAAWGVSLVLRGGAAFQRVLDLVGRIPASGARAVAARLRSEGTRTDATLAAFFGAGFLVHAQILATYTGAWLLEATETWILLHALGSSISWGNAVGVEALVMLARNVLVFLPGGLGAQELGYATLLVGVGGDLGVCGALALLKRARELVFVLGGFGLLGLDRMAATAIARSSARVVAASATMAEAP